MWKKKQSELEKEARSSPDCTAPKWNTRIKALFSTPTPSLCSDCNSNEWRPRRFAIMFSKHELYKAQGNNAKTWTFLVLVQPSDEELLLSYREVGRKNLVKQNPNARCSTGRCYYSVEDKPLREVINCLASELSSGSDFLEFVRKLGKDTIWGWEELLNKVIQIPSVDDSTISSLICCTDENRTSMERVTKLDRSLLGSF